jgi:hypothetical protein
MILNLSARGACLEVTSTIGIPDEFVLVIESDGVQKHCRVAWRRESRIGVAFN